MKRDNPMATALRGLLATDRLLAMPCCFDALSAKLIQHAGFEVTFMSGFAVSAARLGAPDLGLMSYGEVVDQARLIADVLAIPMIVDGDTGYGNAMNVRRTTAGFVRAGCAGVLIEDQVAPKRCGHTPGKEVVGRDEAFDRIKAAVDAREEFGDILIMGRTDANHTHGLEEAILRARRFHDIGADLIFVEAPKTITEMEIICREVPGYKMANMVEGGATPILPMQELQDMGFRLVAWPLTLLSASMQAMETALQQLKADDPRTGLMDFATLQDRIGFSDYYARAAAYGTSRRD